jgi:NPCBM/NEW2 domain-containing protein
MRIMIAAGALALGAAMLPVTVAHAASTWVVTVKASATTVDAGHKVTFTGKVRPIGAAAGEKVLLQERFAPGKPWVTQKKATIGRTGKYQVSDKPTANTRHSYRVVMPAAGHHTKGVSQTAKVTVYAWTGLGALDWVNDNNMRFGPVAINGTTYDDSVYTDFTGAHSVEFNLDHQCDGLRSRFGISDNSTTGGQTEVGVLADGTSVYDKVFDLGQSEQKTVPLDNPLKIKLLATDTSTAPGVDGLGAFGNAQAHCTR